MRATTLVQALPYERFAHQQLNVFFCPFPGGKGLEEHHYFLKVHFAELVGPFDEEGGADVEVERRKSIFFGLSIASVGSILEYYQWSA